MESEDAYCWRGGIESRLEAAWHPATGRISFPHTRPAQAIGRLFHILAFPPLRLILNRGFGDCVTLRNDCSRPTKTPLLCGLLSEVPLPLLRVSNLPLLLHRLLICIC